MHFPPHLANMCVFMCFLLSYHTYIWRRKKRKKQNTLWLIDYSNKIAYKIFSKFNNVTEKYDDLSETISLFSLVFFLNNADEDINLIHLHTYKSNNNSQEYSIYLHSIFAVFPFVCVFCVLCVAWCAFAHKFKKQKSHKRPLYMCNKKKYLVRNEFNGIR